MHRSPGTRFRARWILVALGVAGAPAVAFADIAPEVCAVDNFKRYLGEECVRCETGASEPESCRRKYEAKGLAQRCFTTRGENTWVELWCGPRAAALDDAGAVGVAAPVAEAAPVAVVEVAPVAEAAPVSPGPTNASTAWGCRCTSAGSPGLLVALGLLWRRRRGR